jgi:hypothetical protein
MNFLFQLGLRVDATQRRTTPLPGKPRWDEESRELWYGNQKLKAYRRNAAKNQIDLIEAFHRVDWARSIPDPFNNARKLNQTLRDLNSALAVNPIRFYADGSEGVGWEPSNLP